MELIIESTGLVRCIYSEAIPLRSIGSAKIVRASNVEPSQNGEWFADLIDGPQLGPFAKRTEALAAEVQWLRTNWLMPVPS